MWLINRSKDAGKQTYWRKGLLLVSCKHYFRTNKAAVTDNLHLKTKNYLSQDISKSVRLPLHLKCKEKNEDNSSTYSFTQPEKHILSNAKLKSLKSFHSFQTFCVSISFSKQWFRQNAILLLVYKIQQLISLRNFAIANRKSSHSEYVK